MICQVNNNLIIGLEEDFPDNINDSKEELIALRKYFKEKEMVVSRIIALENIRIAENISLYDYFQNFFDLCYLRIDESDKKKILDYLLGSDYQIKVLKTEIPRAKYDGIHSECALLNGKFAVSKDIEINDNHVYSCEELVSLQNQSKIMFLAMDGIHQDVMFADFLSDYKPKYDEYRERLIPLDFSIINRSNYLRFLVAYPELLEYIRKNLNYEKMEEALSKYEFALTQVFNNKVTENEEMLKRQKERRDNLKIFRKK